MKNFNTFCTVKHEEYIHEKWHALIADGEKGLTEITAYSFDDVMCGIQDYKKKNADADILNINIYVETVKE